MKRFFLLLFWILTLPVFAQEHETDVPSTSATQVEATEEGEFKPGEMILHHVADAHEWHFATIGHSHITLPLPVIAYQPGKGLSVFSSSKLAHGQTYQGLKLEHEKLEAEDGSKVYDFSITKNVASLLLSAVLLIGIFFSVASGYAKRRGQAPSGIQSFFEPIIAFIRDDVAKQAIGPKYERYLPYLLTLFFFIWFNNLLGLLPGGANLTGNISITLMLAVLTLLITNFSGNKYYWGHIFATPGVPGWLRPIMIPVELIGIITKPFSLMVRLFANITAGHIIVLSFISLIFIFKSVAVAPLGVGFALFINVLEMLVAILQAYLFTLLSAMYIGGAVEEHHHDNDLGIGGEHTHNEHAAAAPH